jgi:hypothetical protein
MSRPALRTALATVACAVALQASGLAQFGFGGGADAEVKLVAQYDADRDGRLNSDERRAARAATRGGSTRGRMFAGSFGRTPVSAGKRIAPADIRQHPSTPLYDLGTLRTIFLDFESPDWEEELSAFYNTDVEVPATMTVDGKVYKDVGIHFRGQSSYRMVSPGYKRSLNVSLDFVHGKQDFGGYQTLNLLNANNDPTFLRSVLYTEISRQFIPTPKANYVRVVINGENWGVYVNAQQFNGDFISEAFGGKGGARWKAPGSPRGRAGLEYLGEDAAAYRRIYEIKTKDDAESWAALIRLCKVLNETPVDKLEAALEPILDVEGALKFLALEVALVNSDGYWARASDYNLYRDASGRFHIVPHDVNEALGGDGGRGFGRTGPTLDPLVGLNDPSKPLRSRLLAAPALRQRYLGHVRQIADKWLDWEALSPMLQSQHRLIAAEVRADTRKLYDVSGFEAAITPATSPLKAFLDARRQFLLDYTAGGQGAERRTAQAR